MNKQSQWAIVKQEWWVDGTVCEHPLCGQFHTDRRTGKRNCPEVRRVEWIIQDTKTLKRMGDAHTLRRDAVRELEWRLGGNQ